MQYTIPDYYREFQCIADKCPDTCCAGWQIVIDEASRKKYRRLKTPFGNRLKNGIDWKEGVFRQHGRRCEFLDEDNLCDIYREAGKHMLCRTCRIYPRHIEEFEGLREISLSMSCPEAARIILGQKGKVQFLHGEKETAEEDYGDFDFLLFTNLCDARDYLLEILQDRSVSVNLRIAKALAYAHDFQCCRRKNEMYRLQEITEQHRKTGFGERFERKCEEYTKDVENPCAVMGKMWKTVISEMEVLRPEWRPYLQETLGNLYENGDEGYRRAVEELAERYPAWETQAEQLLVYWVFTYFCGAVYDGDAFTKMKLATVSVLFVRDLAAAELARKGTLTEEDMIAICYRYSREQEHSDLNLNRMEELLAEKSLFLLGNLLSVL